MHTKIENHPLIMLLFSFRAFSHRVKTIFPSHINGGPDLRNLQLHREERTIPQCLTERFAVCSDCFVALKLCTKLLVRLPKHSDSMEKLIT